MTTDVEIDRALATVAATMNDQKLEQLEPKRVSQLVNQALGGKPKLTVDEGGGIHDETGTRVGVVRRTNGGGWITERQNPAAERSDTAIPTEPGHHKLRNILSKLRLKD